MKDVTQMLNRIDAGDAAAIDEFLPIVYDELRRIAAVKMAGERSTDSLHATALVHEAYLRLVGSSMPVTWNGRRHFFAAAVEAMRRILIDRARNRKRLKRGGDRRPIDVDLIDVALDTPDDEILALDESLGELSKCYPDCAELVTLRFFGGMSIGQAAESLGIPRRTAERKWAFARAWLLNRLGGFAESGH